MVRVSGFLDEGTDVRRSVASYRGRHEAASGTVGNNLATRRLQHYHPAEPSDRVHRGVVDNDNFRQERRSRRPQPQHFGTSSTSQQMKHQSAVEMKPLLSESESKSSILAPVTSQTTYNDGELSSNNTETSSGTQAMNHRNLHYSNPTAHQVPGRPTRLLTPHYHTQVSDDEEGDIVCCDDCYQHEGTKNICTIFIWAIAVFFVTNRFFVHMSNYIRQGDEVTDRIVNAGSNHSSIIDMTSGP